MPGITFTPEDIIAFGEIPANWYPVIAKSIVGGAGKTDPSSTTWTSEFEIVDGERKGAKVPYWFSNKMKLPMFRYLKCFVPDLKAGNEYPIEETVDRPVQAYILWDAVRQQNIIKDFKPIGR